MITIIFIASHILVNLILMYIFYRLQKKIVTLPIYILMSVILLGAIYIFAEIFRKLDIYLMNKQIFIELGHGSIMTLIILFLSLVGALVLAIILGIEKLEKKN